MFVLVSKSALATPGNGKCGGQPITNANHFFYSGLTLETYPFNGTGGSVGPFYFDVTAPSGGQVFPDCGTPDTAQFQVQDITLVTNASGVTVNTDLDTSSGVGAEIAQAFSFTPSSNAFSVGDEVTVSVTLTNPNVDPTAYGTYSVKLAAKETNPSSDGIGVGPGVDFTLVLGPPLSACTDTTLPIVTPIEPSGVAQELGLVEVKFSATDPVVPGCTDQLVSMNYSAASAGGTDHSAQLGSLTEDLTLPQAAGVIVTGTGSFKPRGWTGSDGTVNGRAFASDWLSGIGTYTITETAEDSNNNTGTASDTFSVQYTLTEGHTVATGGNSGKPGQVHYVFTVNRSADTSDGAFMVDETIAVAVRLASSNAGTSPTAGVYLARNYFGCGNPHGNVQIYTTTNLACSFSPTPSDNYYATDFISKTDWSASSSAAYVADIWFLDVDGNWVNEGSLASETF